MVSKVEISHRTIIFTIALISGLWALLQIRDILYLLFISFLLMTALRPLVDGLERIRLPRIISILLIYGIVFGLLGFVVASAIPSLIVQTSKLIHELPFVVERVMPYWNIDIRSVTQQIAPVSENIFRLTLGIFSNIITTLTVLVLTFYFLLEHKHTEKFIVETLGSAASARIMRVVTDLEKRLGAWVIGELFLMFCVGLFVYIGLAFVLHVDFALPLAIFAGILEIVPMIGPIVSAVPAVLVAFATSPILAVSVVALYFIVQQLENNLLVPKVMQRAVGLNPVVSIVALLIGAKLAGVLGVVLAIPVATALSVLFHDIFHESEEEPVLV